MTKQRLFHLVGMVYKNWGWCSLVHVMSRFFMTRSIRTRRPKLRRRLMEITMFIAWVCYGVLAYLESWLIRTVYLTCFVQFLLEMEVVFVHLALWVDFVIGYTVGREVVPICLEQHCLFGMEECLANQV